MLAHGWTEQLSFWGPVIRRLRDRGLRTVAYDLRGHGSSGLAADGDYSIERFGEDVEAVLAAADAPAGALVVAGHSLGGISIAAWAADHDVAARIAGAALVNTGVDDLIGGALVLGEIGKRLNPRWLSRAVLGSSAPLLPLSTPVEQAVIRYTAFGPTASAAQVAFYERMLMQTPANVRAASGIALSDLHLGSALAKLTVPTLVIAGDRDRLTPPEHSRRIVEALPSVAGLLELERTGHMSPLERPAEVADAIAGLVGRSSQRPRTLEERPAMRPLTAIETNRLLPAAGGPRAGGGGRARSYGRPRSASSSPANSRSRPAPGRASPRGWTGSACWCCRGSWRCASGSPAATAPSSSARAMCCAAPTTSGRTRS